MIVRSARARLKELLVRSGVTRLLAPVFGGCGAILVMHRVRPPHPDIRFATNLRNIIAPDLFRDLLEALSVAKVDVVGLDDIPGRLSATRRPPFVCLTFDDGYRDNHDVVLPIAAEHGVPLTVYVAPGLIDGTAPLWWYGLDLVIAREARLRLPIPGFEDLAIPDQAGKERAFGMATRFIMSTDRSHRDRVAADLTERYGVDFGALAREHMMSWDMIRAMAEAPGVEIGAHTLTHPGLAGLDAEAAAGEIAGSRDRLAGETGRPIRHFAYPFGTDGTIGRREVELAAAAGFRSAVTGVPGNLGRLALEGRHAWPRHGIGPDDDRSSLVLKLAGASRAMFRRRPFPA